MKKAIQFFLFLGFILISIPNFAQLETRYWFFGKNAGLDFGTSPTAHFEFQTKTKSINNGRINTREGCSTISDSLGNLLFYTNGVNVWNRLHVQMPNGYGLLGDTDASQSAHIVKKPGSNNIYYIFTVAARAESPGFRYSIVDLNQAGGQGDVVQKNTLILTPVTEKITVVNQRNDHDIWVFVHGWNNNLFYAYPVTNNGIGTPVVSQIGSIHGGIIENSQGCMKASSDGTKLAAAIQQSNVLEVFNLNDSSGVLSNPITLKLNGLGWIYGVEFSPTCQFLYFTKLGIPGALVQANLAYSTADSIIAAYKTDITSFPLFGALQIGLDCNIYMAVPDSSRLGLNQSPDVFGSSVAVPNFHLRTDQASNFGLPSFNQSYFLVPTFKHWYICYDDTTIFNLRVPYKFRDVTWNFGDPQSGVFNTATGYEPVHKFTKPGVYEVIVSGTLNNGRRRTSKTYVSILGPPYINIGKDTAICQGQEIVLRAPVSNFKKYYWSTGDTVMSVKVKSPGTYWLEVTSNEGCVNRDSIVISVVDAPYAFPKQKETICYGDNILLKTLLPDDIQITWPDSSHGRMYSVNKSGMYTISYLYNNCTIKDSVEVSYINCPEQFMIPNIFTPNGDTKNDVFIIKGLAPGQAEVSIFNRWGTKVYYSEAYNQDWEALNTSSGMYYYTIYLKETNQTYKGWLEISR